MATVSVAVRPFGEIFLTNVRPGRERKVGKSLRAIRRLNNNAVVCRDSTGREVIAMGKGVGFGDVPRELSLDEVERTFYDLDEGNINVMSDLPPEVVLFTAKIMDIAQNELSYELSPNAVLLLADHLNFAMERVRKNIQIKMPLAYDVQHMYPVEYKLGQYTVDKARKEFRVGLDKDEAVGIAMNIINARKTPSQRPEGNFDHMLEEVTEIVENHFHIMVDRESFNFSRYATHIQYLFQRIQQKTTIDTENLRMYKDLREEFPDIAQCVEAIAGHIKNKWGSELSEEEKLYLILHVNRIIAKEGH